MFANEAHFCLECYTSYRISPLKVPIVEAEETMAMYALHSIRRSLGRIIAGLNERWRELEDEGRRAGAQPGWLRP